MPRWQRAWIAACAGVAAWCLTYLAVDYLRLPRLFYYQHARVWRLEARPAGPLPSGYVGLWAWAAVAGVAVAAAAWLASGWRRRPLGERTLGLAAAWAFTAFGLAGAYYSWHNWP